MAYRPGMAVLIADNDRAVSGLLADVLGQSGIVPGHAYDGEEAKRLARDPNVRVLVCDLDMPGATGLEVLESLRDLERPPLVVVVSGYLDGAIEAQLRTMSFVREVLRKPFDLLGFAAIIRRLVAQVGEAPARDAGDAPGAGPSDGADGAGGAERTAGC